MPNPALQRRTQRRPRHAQPYHASHSRAARDASVRGLVRSHRERLAREGARLHRGDDPIRTRYRSRPAPLCPTAHRSARHHADGRARPSARQPHAQPHGDLRADRDQRATGSSGHPRGQDHGMEEHGPARLSAPHARRRCPDRLDLSLRHQHTAGAPGVGGLVQGCRLQGHGEPGLAQGEERLGGLERTPARRGAHRAPDPRRDAGAGAPRPEGDRDLAPCRPGRARGRPEGPAVDQEHGRGDHRGLASRTGRPCGSVACAARSS